jgi:hypothetical protein
MRKNSHYTVSHTPHYDKNNSFGITCQPKHSTKPGKIASREKSEQRLIACLVIILVIIWVIAALITQNFFLLSGIPLLARELAYLMHRAIDDLFPV